MTLAKSVGGRSEARYRYIGLKHGIGDFSSEANVKSERHLTVLSSLQKGAYEQKKLSACNSLNEKVHQPKSTRTYTEKVNLLEASITNCRT